MLKHTVHWVNDHTQICERLDARVQLMEDYLDGKPADFEGIAVKQFLLGQAREQVSWYRQSIDALDYVGCVACRRALETGQPFLEHYLPAFSFQDTERGTEYQRDATFPILPELWSRYDTETRFDDAMACLPPSHLRRGIKDWAGVQLC